MKSLQIIVFFSNKLFRVLKYGVAQEMELLYHMCVLLQGMTLLQRTFCERKTCRSNESGKSRLQRIKATFC